MSGSGSRPAGQVIRLRGLRFDGSTDDPIDPVPAVQGPVPMPGRSAIRRSCTTLATEAKAQGLSQACILRLQSILDLRWDVFRLRISHSAPASFDPLHLQLKINAKPFAALQRRYEPGPRKLLANTTKAFWAAGAMQRMTHAHEHCRHSLYPRPI